MERMTKEEMILYLKGMKERKEYLEKEKNQLLGSIESLEDAIERNTFSRRVDETGIPSGNFAADKILRILLDSQRDIEEETRSLVLLMRDIYEEEDKLSFVSRCLMRLPGKERALLQEVYVEDTAVRFLARRKDMGRSNIYRLLRDALQHLLTLYNDGCGRAESPKAERLMREVSAYLPEGQPA